MSNCIQSVAKWLPTESKELENVFDNCCHLQNDCHRALLQICTVLKNMQQNVKNQKLRNSLNSEFDLQELEEIDSKLHLIVYKFNEVLPPMTSEFHPIITLEKLKIWKDLLWKIKLKICYVVGQLVAQIAYLYINYGEVFLILTLKISSSYNNLYGLDQKFGLPKNASICTNACPYLFYPLRKISVTRLLQIVSQNRAEICCHKLIDCLLETYKLYETVDDDNSSDNSSIEIYRALTKHMSPVKTIEPTNKNQVCDYTTDSKTETFSSITELITNEEKNILDLLEIILKESPSMLGSDGVKKSKHGATKISVKARQKVVDYYEEILWTEVGNYLEHIILWWAPSPLSARPPHSSQHLREWITQFIPNVDIPSIVVSALSCLADALGVHVTLTSWDQQFRLALVASKASYNGETGKLFCNVLQDLIALSNQCEVTPDWFFGAPLEELPLVEQIPILHRLDHSIHTTRLWAASETKKIANNWNVDAFFMITHTDIVNCIAQLNTSRFADHISDLEKEGLGVHVQVCALMRAKLVSEVKENGNKLKVTPNECVDNLASICRTTSLANLQMIFPGHTHWSKMSTDVPENASSYVATYFDRILTPILTATDDQSISNMILEIMCQSWLDNIYINKIKFSHYGASQLLCDFASIKIWLKHCPVINQDMYKKMTKNEILRRCEGVGRLLLRCPGEQLKMTSKTKKITANTEKSPNLENTELMPAEMYVPNQEQWLALRAMKKHNLFSAPLCCGKF